MKTVYFVRHGKTEGNQFKIFQDPSLPLSADGEKEVSFLAERFTSIPVDCVYTSSMVRAQQTAAAIGAVVNKAPITLQGIEEIERPKHLYGKKRDDEEAQKILQEWWDNIDNASWESTESESYESFRARLKEALEHIANSEGEHIVVVTHSIALRMLLGLMVFDELFTPRMFERTIQTTELNNTGLTVAKYNDKKWRLGVWNDLAHLGE